jgi:transcriptional antiterminator RfaH
MSGSTWIVARTKPSRERWAAENVANQGYDYYFPKIFQVRKNIARAEPLFPCYLFIKTDGSWRVLLSTFGISSVVVFGNSPATVSQQIIDNFKARETDGCVELPALEECAARFKEGERVRIKEGLFSGHVGVYQGQDPKQREKVLLDFLGRKTSVLLIPELLEAA